eukprot:11326517-Alexandrium_andersonii.AAC.1
MCIRDRAWSVLEVVSVKRCGRLPGRSVAVGALPAKQVRGACSVIDRGLKPQVRAFSTSNRGEAN